MPVDPHIITAFLPLALMLMDKEEDRQQIARLYLEYSGLMRKIAAQYFPKSLHDQEDAVSDAAMRLCKNADSILRLECHKIPAYIVKICRSSCIDRLRKRRTEALCAGDEVLDMVQDKEHSLDAAMSRSYAISLLKSFSGLSQRDQELIRMRHIDQMDFEEIAQIMGISAVSARSAISRAKQRLQDRAWDLWGELLLDQETQNLLKEVEQEANSTADPEREAFIKEQDKKNLMLIQRQMKKQRERGFLQTAFPRVLRAAAILLAAFTLAGGVALAASPALRV